jgi:predicted metal-dependent peptidase
MSVNINSIKRKTLIRFPTFGSIIANTEFKACKEIKTAETDGKVVFYNPEFVEKLSEMEQVFLFVHELCHGAFEHMYRGEGKDADLWNIATDAVINALLQKHGLPMIKGGVDIPEAVNYDSEEMYNKLIEEKKKQEQQNSQGGQYSSDKFKEWKEAVSNTHDLWDKAMEERKKEQSKENEQDSKDSKKQSKENEQDSKDNKKQSKENGQDSKESQKSSEEKDDEISEFVKKGEREIFKQNENERIIRLQELSKELAKESSGLPGNETQHTQRGLSDIGIATALIDWRRLLRQEAKYDEEWTRKNARMRNGYFRHRLEEIPTPPETEIVLDISGSVSEIILKNFLRECKNIFANSKVKIGCFNTKFYGFTELKKVEDIDNMKFPIGGGTDFNAAVGAFSRRAQNKIIFTDGLANMPEETAGNVIWVVYGNKKINPKGGKVIYINEEQLKELESQSTRYLSR